jgi:hypothetical protein
VTADGWTVEAALPLSAIEIDWNTPSSPATRSRLFPKPDSVLQRWFHIPYPSRRDLSILPDSDLSTNPCLKAKPAG